MSEALTQKLSSMFLNFSTQWSEGYQTAEAWADQVTMQIPSTSEATLIGWMDKLPTVREWIGPRVIQNASLRNRTLINKDWELSLGVPRNALDDDQHGLYAPMAKMQGEQFKIFPQQYIATNLILANSLNSIVGFDGVSFFNAAHPTNLDDAAFGTQSNIVTSADGSLITGYKQAKAKMRGFKGADGKPMGIMGDTIVVAPKREQEALQLFNGSFYPQFVQGNSTAGNVGAADNVWKGAGKTIVASELDGPGDDHAWLLCTSKAVRPFVHQVRKAPTFVPLFNPTDPNVAFAKEYLMLSDSRDAFDVSLWFLAIRIDGLTP